MKNAVKKINVNKLRKFNIKLCVMLGTIAMALCNTMTAFAAASAGSNSENTKPTNIGGASTMNTAVSIVFWVIRVAIILIGGAPGIVKVVQGQSDENPRDRNAGLATIGIAGAAFAATFAIQGLI